MRRPAIIGMGACVVMMLLAGCGKRLLFTTYTKVGLDISTADGQTPNAVFGYKRFEGAIIPVDPDKATQATSDQPGVASVYGAMDLKNEWFGGLRLFQVFATGKAADDASANPDALAKFIKDAHAAQAETETGE